MMKKEKDIHPTNIIQTQALIIAFEGVLAFLWVLRQSSEKDSAFFLGYSAERLGLALGILSLVGGFLWLAWSAFKNKAYLSTLFARLTVFFDKDLASLCHVLVWLGFSIGFSLLLLGVWLSPLAPHLNALRGYLTRLLPIQLWFTLVLLQVAVLIWWHFPPHHRQHDSFKNALVLPLIFFSTLTVLCVLVFRIHLFLLIDGWYFPFRETPTPHIWLALPVFALVIGLIALILKNPDKVARNLILLVLMTYGLQLSFGWMEAQGIETLRSRYMRTGFRSYALYAADEPTFNAIFEYGSFFSNDFYAGTKPPGVILFYELTRRFSSLFFSQDTYDLRYQNLVTFFSYAYPLFAGLGVLVLYIFARQFLNRKDAYFPAILYIFFPNFLLMTPFLDQALYPFLFISVLTVVGMAMRKASFGLAFLSGVLLYLALFVSFSLLPLVFLIFLWFSLSILAAQNRRVFFGLFFAIIAGIAFTALIFYNRWHYDTLARYQFALVRHHAIKGFTGLGDILYGAFLNSAEYIFSVGMSVVILAFVYLYRVIFKLFAQLRCTGASSSSEKCLTCITQMLKTITLEQSLGIAFVLTILLLLGIGQTRGEVGRLWLFLNPLVAFWAGLQTQKLFSRPFYGVRFVVALQWLTTIFIFKFQNFFS